MLTLQRLKEIVDTPKMDQKMPSAKRLAECEKTVAWKKLGEDMEVAAYKNGYALYRIHQAATVFPIHACGGYQYGMGDSPRIGSEQFGQEAWYLRLALEGEDRLCRNQEARERRKTVSYSAESEDWQAMATGSDPVLGRVIMEEGVDEHLALLTDKQRLAVRKYYCL